MKHWYTYKITFNDGKFYIGYRGSVKMPADDFLIKYFSSSKEVKNKIQNSELFSGVILKEYADKETAYIDEQDMIFIEINNPNILNKFCYKDRKGYGLLTASAKKKIAESSKQRWNDPEYRSKIIESQKNRWTDELKERQVARLTGKKRPEHSIKMSGRKNPKISDATKGVSKPEGFGAKISAATKGVPKSEEHRRNMSISAQKRSQTPEYKQKRSEINLMSTKKECPHCLKEVDVRNFGRYHGIKCKQYQSDDFSKK